MPWFRELYLSSRASISATKCHAEGLLEVADAGRHADRAVAERPTLIDARTGEPRELRCSEASPGCCRSSCRASSSAAVSPPSESPGSLPTDQTPAPTFIDNEQHTDPFGFGDGNRARASGPYIGLTPNGTLVGHLSALPRSELSNFISSRGVIGDN
jgi:hypothetical protein